MAIPRCLVFYAIQNIPTLMFVPAGGKQLGGHTKQEPTFERPPRIFLNLLTARAALRAYLSGKWYEHHSVNYFGEYDSDGPEPKKGTQRDKNDFRIVTLQCKVKY